jgi:hypothetical protein
MKPEEFRLGNYAQDQETKAVLECVHLNSALKPNIGFKVVDRNKYPLKDGWQAEPIPLSEDVLIKWCGFVKPQNRDCVIRGRIQVWKQMCYLIEEDTMKAHWIPVKLEHLHQLQNLVYAIEGKELEVKIP